MYLKRYVKLDWGDVTVYFRMLKLKKLPMNECSVMAQCLLDTFGTLLLKIKYASGWIGFSLLYEAFKTLLWLPPESKAGKPAEHPTAMQQRSLQPPIWAVQWIRYGAKTTIQLQYASPRSAAECQPVLCAGTGPLKFNLHSTPPQRAPENNSAELDGLWQEALVSGHRAR